MIFEHHCSTCNKTDEAKFVFVGSQVTQVCNACGAYARLFDRRQLPGLKRIKEACWITSNSDLLLIEDAKEEIKFLEHLKGTNEKMMYWKLYLKLRDYAAIGKTAKLRGGKQLEM